MRGPDDVEAFRQAAERQTKEWTASREAAQAYLVYLGIHNPDGSLTLEYGGERTAPREERQAHVSPFGLTISD